MSEYEHFDEFKAAYIDAGLPENSAAELAYNMCEQLIQINNEINEANNDKSRAN